MTHTYLKDLSDDQVKSLVKYPSELYHELYQNVAENNGYWAQELAKELLGGDYEDHTKYDDCSYDWWLTIRPGHYEHFLAYPDATTTLGYFNEDTAQEIRDRQKRLATIVEQIGEMSDIDDDELVDEADKIANEILQYCVTAIKDTEKVTDEQIEEEAIEGDWFRELYYIKDGDTSTVYRDYTKAYKTNQGN